MGNRGQDWFTSCHHRETPQRIEEGQADVGIVWTTEVVHARAQGRRVNYAIGTLKSGRNPCNAARFLSYLGTDRAGGSKRSTAFSAPERQTSG